MSFFKHLDSVNMTYLEHLFISLHYAFILFVYAIQAFIHAFIPDVFITSTSDCINNINSLLNKHQKIE